MTIPSTIPFILSIDKISITANDLDHTSVEESCHQLTKTAASSPGRLQARSGRRYFIQTSFSRDQSFQLLIQAGPRFSGIPDYRFEFNPNKLGPDGISQVIEFINSHFPTGIQQLFSNGIVTRIDLALDLPGRCLDQVVVRSAKARKHSVYTGANGAIETTYLGSGVKSRTVVYAKKTEETDYLRLERRMRPRCPVSTLSSLPNPFDQVQIVPIEVLTPILTGMIPRQFFDSIRMRGLNHVLADLPAAQRKTIRAIIADPNNSVMPPPDQVWSRWPAALNQAGLLIFTRNFAAAAE